MLYLILLAIKSSEEVVIHDVELPISIEADSDKPEDTQDSGPSTLRAITPETPEERERREYLAKLPEDARRMAEGRKV